MNLYSYYNRVVGFYTVPHGDNADKGSKIESVRRAIKLNMQSAIENHLQECELVYYGDFNDVTGELQILAKPEVLVNLAEFFPAPKVATDD